MRFQLPPAFVPDDEVYVAQDLIQHNARLTAELSGEQAVEGEAGVRGHSDVLVTDDEQRRRHQVRPKELNLSSRVVGLTLSSNA